MPATFLVKFQPNFLLVDLYMYIVFLNLLLNFKNNFFKILTFFGKKFNMLNLLLMR